MIQIFFSNSGKIVRVHTPFHKIEWRKISQQLQPFKTLVTPQNDYLQIQYRDIANDK